VLTICITRVFGNEIKAVSALEKKAEAIIQSKRSTRYRILALPNMAVSLPFYHPLLKMASTFHHIIHYLPCQNSFFALCATI
jgi:hypothetical protein